MAEGPLLADDSGFATRPLQAAFHLGRLSLPPRRTP